MRRRPDTELVALAREGSADATGALFDRYWALAWRTTYAVTADRGLADDAAQEAFVKAFAALGRFDETQPFARAARAWALLSGRDYVTPVDVEELFLSVVMHRIVFTPSFVAAAREVGWEAAADRFRERCLEIAPRPGAELEPEDEPALAVAQ